MSNLMLGYAREDFTPYFPVRMNSQCTSDEVWHKIYANALYFQDGQEQALVINLDVRELYTHFVDPLRPELSRVTGIPQERIIMATTHNHSSPDVGASNEVESCIRWKNELGYPAIIRAAQAAMADAKPVTRLAAGTALSSDKVNFVRRYRLADGTWKGIATANPSTSPRVARESDADLELRAVRISREGGKDVILMNYQTHAAGALAMYHEKLNADFCGEMRDTVEEATGALAVYLQGACGNTNYTPYFPEEFIDGKKPSYDVVGVMLGKTALEALENAVELPLGRLKFRGEQLYAPVNHSMDHLMPTIEKIHKLETPEERNAAMRAAGINNRYEMAGITRRAALPEKSPAELCSIAIGDFAMAFCPHEMFDILGKQLRDASPYAMTFPCNYAQVYCGYMPSQKMVPHGEYEVNMNRFIPGIGETEIITLLKQLNEMKKED